MTDMSKEANKWAPGTLSPTRPHPTSLLRARYHAMPGLVLTKCVILSSAAGPHVTKLAPYAPAMPCPVLTERTELLLSAYAPDTLRQRAL